MTPLTAARGERLNQLLWAIRALVWALTAADLQDSLWNPLQPGPLGVALAVVSAAACVVCLHWPLVGAATTTVLIASALVHEHPGYAMTPLIVTGITLAASARARYVAGFLMFDAVLLGAQTRPDEVTSTTVVLLVPTAIGLVVRALNARAARADVRVAELTRTVADLRRDERARLGAELSRVVASAGRDTDLSLARARAAQDPAAIRACLRDVETTARSALSGIRHLIATLRAGDPTGPPPTTDAAWRAALDAEEDALVGHGFTVELVGFEPGPTLDPVRGALIDQAVRAAGDHMREHCPAGAVCELTLTPTGSRGLTFSASHPQPATAPGPAAGASWGELRSSVAAASGTLDIGADDDRWTLRLSMPDGGSLVTPTGVTPAPGGARLDSVRLDGVLAVRAGLGMAALFLAGQSVLAGVGAADPAPQDAVLTALWAGTYLSVTLALWTPRVGLVALAAALTAGIALTPPALATQEPTQVALVALGAAVSVRRPRWLPVTLVVWVIVWALWCRGSSIAPTEAVLMHVYPVFGVLLGMTARLFMARRSHHRTALETLAREQATARERERRELAGELHDIVAHQLSLISLYVMSRGQSPDRADLHGLVDELADLNTSARADMVRLKELLRPTDPGDSASMGDDQGLSPTAALTEATNALTTAGFQVVARLAPEAENADPTTRQTLSRLVREASTNVIRYAKPGSTCLIDVAANAGVLEASVTNTLPAGQRHHPDSTGWGLVGLDERIHLTGGLFSAGALGNEWRVAATLPRWAD